MVDIGSELLVHLSLMPVNTIKKDAEIQTDNVIPQLFNVKNCQCELPLPSSQSNEPLPSSQSNDPLPSSQSNDPLTSCQSNDPPPSTKLYPGDFFKSEIWKSSTFDLDDDFELDF